MFKKLAIFSVNEGEERKSRDFIPPIIFLQLDSISSEKFLRSILTLGQYTCTDSLKATTNV